MRFDWVRWQVGRNCQGTGEGQMVGNVEQAAALGNLGLTQTHPFDTLSISGNN